VITIFDEGEYLQQRAFARAIAPNNAHHLPALHLEGDVSQGPEIIELSAKRLKRVSCAFLFKT